MPKEYTGSLIDLVAHLREELCALPAGSAPRVLGFAGPPGVGKSTAVAHLAAALPSPAALPSGPRGVATTTAITSAAASAAAAVTNPGLSTGSTLAGLAPLDGFHKSNEVLELEGLRDQKGAPPTFDVVGYLMALDLIHAQNMPLYLPGYDRDWHQPIAARHRVEASGIVLTEGNYLALQDEAWALVREQIDLLIYLDLPLEILTERLVQRRLAHGDDPAGAAHWVRTVDVANIRLVQGSAARCDRIWHLSERA